jgi:NAD(P)-dependent dehydrogenase (short-subunit alcohol dehydrogenase family)
MPKRISDQVVVITGASSGIGLATAISVAARGAKVVLAARNTRDLDAAVEVIERDGGVALAVPTDVTQYDQVQALAQRAIDAFGRIDAWVNNAGISTYAYFRDLSVDDAHQIINVNFLGQVHGAKAALPYLEATAGVLVCVGSTLSDRGVPLQSMYCASKHAIKGWIDALRVELREEGSSVRVTLVKPSSINTPLFNKAKTQMGVMPQPIPPIYDPQLAADAILHALESDERDIFVGGAGKFLSTAERISPKLVDVHQRYKGFAAQKTSWPKSADAANNLYAPVPYDGGVRGDFVHGAKKSSVYQAMAAHVVAASLCGAAVLALAAAAADDTRRGRRCADLLAAGALGLAGKALVAFTVQR